MLTPIDGSPPNLADLPEGCRFALRCPFAIEVCSVQNPVGTEPIPGHFVACHRSHEAETLRIAATRSETWQVDR